nr:uncharacterized protein LOC124499209 [Dermatophagoides farinae]
MVINDDNEFWWYDHWLKPTGRETLTVHVFKIENTDELRQNWLETLSSASAPKTLDNQKKKSKINRSSSSSSSRTQSQSQSQSSSRSRTNRNSKSQKQEKDIATVVNRLQPQIREIGPFVFRIERFKENVIFANDEKHQVGYNERVRYHFDQLLSFENLDQKITVVNSELSALNPFVRAIMKKGESVKKISTGLRNVIDQILNLYAMNIFVERPIWRIIFGPNFKFYDQYGDDEDDDDNEQDDVDNDDQDVETIMNERESDMTSSINAKLLSTTTTTANMTNKSINNNTSNVLHTKFTDDETVVKILSLYDKAEPYIKRLGVDIDPYDLLKGVYRYENDAKRGIKLIKMKENYETKKSKKMKLQSQYRQNSVFSFFTNDSVEKYDINTGINDEKNAEIIAWNQHSYVDAWYGRQCNRINGTDGRQFNPFVRESRIYQFIPRLCRSIPLTLTNLDLISSPSGISLRRFSEARDFMQSPFRNKANGCFCRYQNQLKRCNYDGILDMANCYHGAPIILTRPHFSGTITKSIGQSIKGLLPDDQIYQTYLDIEPISGIVLDKMERYQLNVHFPPLPLKLNANRTIPEQIIPLLWYQEQYVASQDYHNHLKYFFIYPMKYQEYGVLSLMSFGLLMLFISLVCVCFCCCTHIPIKNNTKQPGEQLNDIKNGKILLSPSIEPLVKKPMYNSIVADQQQLQQQQLQPQMYGIISRMEPIMHPVQMANMKINNATTKLSNKIHNIQNNIRPSPMTGVNLIPNNDVSSLSSNIYTINKGMDRDLAQRMIKIFSDEFDHGQSTVSQSKVTTPDNMITPVDDLNDQSTVPNSMIPSNARLESGSRDSIQRQPVAMNRPPSKFTRQFTSNNLTQRVPSSIHSHGPYSSLPSTPEHYRGIQSQGSIPISSPSIGTVYSRRSMIVSNPLPSQSSRKQQQKNLQSLIRSSQISEADSGFFQKPDSSSSDIFINQTEEEFDDQSDMKRSSMTISPSNKQLQHIDDLGQSNEKNKNENNQLENYGQDFYTDDDGQNDEFQETDGLSKLANRMKNLMEDSIMDDNDDENHNDRPTLAGVYQLINFARPSWPTRNDILEEIKQRSLELKNAKK